MIVMKYKNYWKLYDNTYGALFNDLRENWYIGKIILERKNNKIMAFFIPSIFYVGMSINAMNQILVYLKDFEKVMLK